MSRKKRHLKSVVLARIEHDWKGRCVPGKILGRFKTFKGAFRKRFSVAKKAGISPEAVGVFSNGCLIEKEPVLSAHKI